MTGTGWRLAGFVSRLLEHDECEAVRGDLMEAGESGWTALRDVLGLVIRRQALLWKDWRPWLAAFGLALPCTLFLMGLAVSLSRSYQQLIGATILKGTGLKMGPVLALAMWQDSLLIGWSWTSGFVVGSLSRRTVWVSAVLSGLPCLFCLARFRVESLSRLCLLLFVLPALWGVWRGLRITRINLTPAIVLAVTVTLLTLPTWRGKGPSIPDWALSWPAWYLVATARRGGGKVERRPRHA